MTAENREKRQYFLVFPERLIRQPILYKVSTEFDVIPNILGASITDKIGKVAIELEGTPERLEAVIRYFTDLGVDVKPLNGPQDVRDDLQAE